MCGQSIAYNIKREKTNRDLTIIQIYMKGDLRYNCGGKVDLCMDKPVF